MLRVVLYAEDTAQVRRIAHQVEEDPSCELIALCATLADLNFVLDRVTVDVLLLRLTPETGDAVLSAAWERTRHAHLVLRVQSGARRQFRVPNDLPLEGLERPGTPIRAQPGRGRVLGAPVANASIGPDLPDSQEHYGAAAAGNSVRCVQLPPNSRPLVGADPERVPHKEPSRPTDNAEFARAEARLVAAPTRSLCVIRYSALRLPGDRGKKRIHDGEPNFFPPSQDSQTVCAKAFSGPLWARAVFAFFRNNLPRCRRGGEFSVS